MFVLQLTLLYFLFYEFDYIIKFKKKVKWHFTFARLAIHEGKKEKRKPKKNMSYLIWSLFVLLNNIFLLYVLSYCIFSIVAELTNLDVQHITIQISSLIIFIFIISILLSKISSTQIKKGKYNRFKNFSFVETLFNVVAYFSILFYLIQLNYF